MSAPPMATMTRTATAVDDDDYHDGDGSDEEMTLITEANLHEQRGSDWLCATPDQNLNLSSDLGGQSEKPRCDDRISPGPGLLSSCA